MAKSKRAVNALLNDEEIALLEKAQEKYITDGKGNGSVRTFLMMGVRGYIENGVDELAQNNKS